MSFLVFYKSPNSTDLHQIAFDGSTWTDLGEIKPTTPGAPPPPKTGPLTSDAAPAVAAGPPVTGPPGRLTLVYKQAGSTNLWWVQSEGSYWLNNLQIQNPDGTLLAPKSDHSPALALGGDYLMMVFKAANSNDLCFAQMSVDNKDQQQKWHLGQTVSSYTNGLIAPKSNVRPSAVVYRNKLFAIYKGESSDDFYFFNYDLETLQWSGNVKISSQPGQPGPIEPKSNYSPSLAVFNDRLYMIYKSPNANDLNYAYFDGTNWGGNSLISSQPGQPGPIKPESNSNPGIAVFDGLLYLIYRGPNSNDLNMATFDGTTWRHNTQIFNQGGGIHPQSDINPAAVSYPYNPLPTR
jgi:hypothetical protein